jgi:putative DNA primase/helicase
VTTQLDQGASSTSPLTGPRAGGPPGATGASPPAGGGVVGLPGATVVAPTPPPAAEAPARRKRGRKGATASGGDGGEFRPDVRDQLTGLVGDIELWHTRGREAWATVPVGGHHENMPVRSPLFKAWLRHVADRDKALTLTSNRVDDFIALLEARAIYVGPYRDTALRVAEHGGRVYLDLCDEAWCAIEIAPLDEQSDGPHWRIVDAPPVKFTRRPGMRALPEPRAGGSIEQLRDFVNVASDDDFVLLLGWLLAAMRPQGPYPILVIGGEQGAAKSSAMRLLRTLVDPSVAAARAAPANEKDLFVAAVNNHAITLDNLSSVQEWLSDALCRLATGGGFASRTLHSDDNETVLEASRPICLNGIPELTRRPDLADRSIVVSFAPIAEDKRRPELEYWAAVAAAAPELLGCLCDAVAFALRYQHDQTLRLPRMADAARWCEAALLAFGIERGSFTRAWSGNRREAVFAVVESDHVATAVLKLLASQGQWTGTPSALLDRLAELVSDQVRRSRQWPNNAHALGTRIKRLAPVLRSMGHIVEQGKGGADSRRYIKLIAATAP